MNDLAFIETLDDLSKRLKQARSGVEKQRKPGRDSSILGGLSVTEVADEDDVETTQMNVAVVMLESWKTLVDALLYHRVFLPYTPSLEIATVQLTEMEEEIINHVKIIVDLMTHTVNNHDRSDCTETRYATLLEIMMSYFPDWEPSKLLHQIWSQNDHELVAELPPHEFRQKAYRVLMSLPWVPSSHGLYSACSFESPELPYADIQPHIRNKFDLIGEKPLPRSDYVHQVLERVRGKSGWSVSISGTSLGDNDGVGKTILGALLVSQTEILEKFTVLWVQLPTEERTGLTYKQYNQCLESICQQLATEPAWPPPVPRLEHRTMREKREEEQMLRAKIGMANLLQSIESNVLVVIDDAKDDSDFQWFQFFDEQCSIVISRFGYMQTTFALGLDELTETESLDLFATEAGAPQNHVMLQTIEAKSIVEQSKYHPLILRTVARWFKLKQVTAGFTKGLEELKLELSMLRHNSAAHANTSKTLAGVMNIILSPTIRQGGQPTILMKLCFASMATVFSGPVPLDAVHSLWANLLRSHKECVAELGENITPEETWKRIWFITEAMTYLGLFSIFEVDTAIFVQLYHPMYVEYGRTLTEELRGVVTFEDTVAKWHASFVAGYEERRKILEMNHLDDTSRAYVLEKLIAHVMDAKMIPKVVERLRDDRFLRERLKAFGFIQGTELHVDDCLLLQKRARESKSASEAETRKVILAILKKVSSVLSNDKSVEDKVGRAMALQLVGFTQADNGSVNEALTQYKIALQLMPAPNHPFNSIILYCQAVLQFARNDHDKALKKVKGCLKVIKEAGHSNTVPSSLKPEMIQLRGDVLVAACDYSGATACYEEALEHMNTDAKIEMGTALYRRARLHLMMGEYNLSRSALIECITWKLNLGEDNTPDIASAYSSLGDIYVELQDETNALRSFQKAIRILRLLDDEAFELDLHLLNGKILSLQKDDEGSIEAFDSALQIIRKFPRLHMDQSAYDLRCIARLYMDRERKAEAISILEEGLALTNDRPESLERASLMFELGHALYGRGESKDGLACFEESLKIKTMKLGECDQVLDNLMIIGNVHKALGSYDAALGVCQKVLHMTEKLCEGDNERIANALLDVGEAHEVLEQYKEAVDVFGECKALLQNVLGEDHLEVANVIDRLATIHRITGSLDEAQECYADTLRIRQASMELSDPKLASTLFGAGVVAKKRKDYEPALGYLLDALEIQKQLQLANETCNTLIEVGNVYRYLNDPSGGITCFEKCIHIIQSSGDVNATLIGTVYLSLGHARLTQNNLQEAMECYDRALSNRTEKLGRDHILTAKASRSMGIIKFLLGSHAEARIYLNDFVRVVEAQDIRPSSVDYVIALHLLGEIDLVEQKPLDAQRSWKSAKGILDQNGSVNAALPGLEPIVSRRIDDVKTAPQKSSFFNRLQELARFEDEVSAELPIDEKIDQLYRKYIFIDD